MLFGHILPTPEGGGGGDTGGLELIKIVGTLSHIE